MRVSLITIAATAILLFSGCGGGSESSSVSEDKLSILDRVDGDTVTLTSYNDIKEIYLIIDGILEKGEFESTTGYTVRIRRELDALPEYYAISNEPLSSSAYDADEEEFTIEYFKVYEFNLFGADENYFIRVYDSSPFSTLYTRTIRMEPSKAEEVADGFVHKTIFQLSYDAVETNSYTSITGVPSYNLSMKPFATMIYNEISNTTY